jgi:NADH-quinone oxidoreductase subunit N
VTLALLDWTSAATEIVLLAATCGVLVLDLFLPDARRHVTWAATLATLAAAAIATVAISTGQVRIAMGGLFVDDPLAHALKVMVFVAVATTLVYSRRYVAERDMLRGEFCTLTLFATLGMCVMISANHALTLYLGLELLSLSLYALVALQRNSAPGTEAAMKYFVLGALASGMLLYGMSMVYGATGTLAIPEIAARIAAGQADRSILVFGLVFVVAGIGFKLGAVPFHMWVPDVYQGAPTAVAMLISTAPKLAAFAFVIRMLVEALGHPTLLAEWRDMLTILAVASMAIGNVTAIAQTNLKRMLAYSTISHMGFLLLGVIAGTVTGYGAAMFYVVVYALMGLGGFGMILMLARAGFEADTLDDFRGLSRRSPWLAFLMLLLMFSMAGIPPTVGFHAKLSVLSAIVDQGFVGLAVVAVLFSLIGAFYYLRVVRLMYFDAPADGVAPIPDGGAARVLLGINALAVLALGLLPGALMTLCQRAIQTSL